ACPAAASHERRRHCALRRALFRSGLRAVTAPRSDRSLDVGPRIARAVHPAACLEWRMVRGWLFGRDAPQFKCVPTLASRHRTSSSILRRVAVVSNAVNLSTLTGGRTWEMINLRGRGGMQTITSLYYSRPWILGGLRAI